ncbi:DUF5018 domain-containing protein [Geobacter sp. AOG1]|uniref:DUF5018 domain-containing protein n=1 Tax=Geobacter sp. AOG1 TaxID=1566346 RepID=UPI001CC6F3AD|nr:DUF5018 domain-containing protein [Geobacter sp. AOG1]GFE56853.1 hypothetical protein AOG1_07320 [Geobacter sp. AOG1]
MKKNIVRGLVYLMVAFGLISCGGASTNSPGVSSSSMAITAYSFSNIPVTGVVNESTKTISLTVPYGTNVTGLVATFTTTGASVKVGGVVQVSETTANDFMNPVVYTVTAADGSTTQYTVTVTVALNSSKTLTSLSILGIPGAINESSKTVALSVPYGTNITSLVATFTTTGASVKVGGVVQVSGTTANDFTNPVVYTVTAADGSTTQYTVTVTVALNSSKTLTSFSILGIPGAINESSKTVALPVPYGTNVTGLVATFTTTGASVKVGGAVQVSGTTANNFTNIVAYTVTAEDNSVATYTVRVTIPNYVHLQSDTGDYIGSGNTYTYTQADALIGVSATGDLLSTSINGDQKWSGYFQVPNSLSQLQPGTFSNLTRYPFNNPAVGGLSWSGEGRGCNTLTGWFVVDNATYSNGNLDAIDLHFEQHCEGGVPALHGQIHWTPYDTTAPAGPVTPPPTGLWQPASGSTPATGNYVYLQSDSGDYIGAGQNYTYTPSVATIALGTDGGHLTVNISGTKNWNGDFKTMNVLSQFQPGYYGNLMRYPFNNPVRGGLNWSGDGRGCSTLTGWYVVDNVTYYNGILTSIDLRFEQHCEGATPALHGQIHWIQ